MWTAGGAGGSGFGGPADAGALAQQYWSALTEAMRSAGGGARQQDPWQAAMQSWSQLAGGGAARNDAGDAIERFSAQARQWFGTMQQVAEQFAGKSASAEEIAGAWKQAMGGGGNPFADLFSGMTGRGQSGFEDWYAQIAPMFGGLPKGGMFDGLRQESMSWLRTPAFGHNREQQERLQALIEAQLELQQKNDAYNALMLEVGREAFDRFERKLAERSEPGRQLQSARALFDLWIDAAEEAYAEIALSAGFRKVYGELVNAQMRVRAGIQSEVERLCGLLGMPGRTEVDSAHRKIAELERQLRRLRDAVSAQTKSAPAKAAAVKPAPADVVNAKPEPKRAARAEPSPKPSAKQSPARKVATRKAAARKAPPRKAPPGKAGTSRAAAKPAVKKAQRQAIAAIAIPEPLKPMSLKPAASAKTAAGKTAKRTR